MPRVETSVTASVAISSEQKSFKIESHLGAGVGGVGYEHAHLQGEAASFPSDLDVVN